MSNANVNERIQELLEQGLQSLDDGDMPAALSAWNEVLSLHPGHERAQRLVEDLNGLLNQRGRARELTGDVLMVVDDETDAAPSTTNEQATPGVVSRRALSRLQSLVEQQAAENRTLNADIRARYSEVLESREALTRAERTILELRDRLATFEKRTADVDAERADAARVRRAYEKQVVSLEVYLADQKAAEGSLRQQLLDLQAELERRNLALTSERDEHAASRALLEEAETRLEQLEMAAEQSSSELAALRAELEIKTADLQAISDQVAGVHAQIEVLRAERDTATGHLSEALSTAEQLQRRTDVAAGEIGDLRRELEKERNHAETLQRRLSDHEAQGASRTTALQSQVDALNLALSEALELGETASAAATTARQELETLRAEHAGTAQKLAEVTAASDELQRTLADRDLSLRTLTEAGMAEARNAQKVKAQLVELTRRAEEADALRARNAEVEASNANLQAALARAQAEAHAQSLAAEALRSEPSNNHAGVGSTQQLTRQMDDPDAGRIALLEAEVERLNEQLRLHEPTGDVSTVGVRNSGSSPAVVSDPVSQLPVMQTEPGTGSAPVMPAPATDPGGFMTFDDMEAEFQTEDIDDAGAAPRAPAQAESTDEIEFAQPPPPTPGPSDASSEPDADGLIEFDLDEGSDDGGAASAGGDGLPTFPDWGLPSTHDFFADHDRAMADGASDSEGEPIGDEDILDEAEHAPTGAWDAVEVFSEHSTDPQRRATASHPVAVPAEAANPDVVNPNQTITGMSFLRDEAGIAALSGRTLQMTPALAVEAASAAPAPSAPPPAPAAPPASSGPTRGRGKKQLSMRSSATARLADPNLSATDQLAWLVDEVPRLTPAGAELIRGKRIGAREAFVVEAIDGSVSFSDIIDVVGLPVGETSAILVDLLRRGVITSPSVE